MDTETKIGIDTAKAVEATGYLIGCKTRKTIACKAKSKEDFRLFQIQQKNRTPENVSPTRYNI